MSRLGSVSNRGESASAGSLPRARSRSGLPVILAILLIEAPGSAAWGAAGQGGTLPESQAQEYTAQVPKSVIELQQFRQTNSIKIEGAGGKQGIATLINLNPAINVWYLLRLRWGDAAPEAAYHLENPNPHGQRLLLERSHPQGLVISEGAEEYVCALWAAGAGNRLDEARRSHVVYAPLCEERIYLRNPTKGRKTALESVTEFLREDVRGGEKIVEFVRDKFIEDLYRETPKFVTGSGQSAEGETREKLDEAPGVALIDPQYAARLVAPTNLGISIDYPAAGGVAVGRWYAAKDNPGIYVSLIQPSLISPQILRSHRDVVNDMDSVEASALVYLIAFDLNRFYLGFSLGTEHPKVDWSDHMLDQMKDKTLPGPDGIGSIAPLVSTGLISPANAHKVAATFTGGFKRTHGAFRYGDLALKNHGTHYGFMENGVVFSKLQPGLSTLFVLDDGSIHMKTWTESDNEQLARIRYARQNGVPIIEFDEATKSPVPGPLVNRWGPGNWSGSEDRRLRTLRAGAALQETQGRRFLIYGVFTSATPSAMARVFQAYGCRYAMLLDMNALEHTYLAVYRRQGASFFVEHLVKGMEALDKSMSGQYVPRFLGYADNRDFFYIMRRDH